MFFEECLYNGYSFNIQYRTMNSLVSGEQTKFS